MHRAKEAGGNLLTLFDENMDRRARDLGGRIAMGCPWVQGYLIARPMPVVDFESFLVGSLAN